MRISSSGLPLSLSLSLSLSSSLSSLLSLLLVVVVVVLLLLLLLLLLSLLSLLSLLLSLSLSLSSLSLLLLLLLVLVVVADSTPVANTAFSTRVVPTAPGGDSNNRRYINGDHKKTVRLPAGSGQPLLVWPARPPDCATNEMRCR